MKFIAVFFFLGLCNLAALGQDTPNSKELKDQVQKRLHDQLIDSAMSTDAYKKLPEERLPRPMKTSENMPVLWISPQVLDQNLTLTYELDWKTPNMPIKDPRKKILKKKP